MEKRWNRRLESNARPGSRIVILAPQYVGLPFSQVLVDCGRHQRLLSSAQQLRRRVYLRDFAIQPSELSIGERHVQPADQLSWHVLTVDENETVTGCLRYHKHQPGVVFSDLGLSRASIAQSLDWGELMREAIQAQISSAARRCLSYVELGGWAISEALRRKADAVRMVLSVYALARITGDALAVTTATDRHNSASILRRMGGRALCADGREVPPYYDPRYGCEMELLTFDSTSPAPQFSALIEDYRTALSDYPVILSGGDALEIGMSSATGVWIPRENPHALP